jgi:hypothetical protein
MEILAEAAAWLKEKGIDKPNLTADETQKAGRCHPDVPQ